MTAAELAVIIKAQNQASAVLKTIAKDTSALTPAAKGPTSAFAALGNAIKTSLAVVGGLAVFSKVSGAISDAAGSAIDFQKSMSGIKAVSGVTGQQMQQLSSLALQLGKDTAFSAGEAAGGIEELIKGGVGIADIMGGAASAALNLAAAGGVSLGEASTIAANAMNQFNLKGSDMAHVSDLVAGAANASSISVSDFNLSLAAVGAVANLAGQSIDSTAVAIALMGAQGIKGSDAGTSLKAALNNLIPTTDVATNKMRELGIITANGTNQFINAQGGMKSMGEIAEILQRQTANLTDSQRLLALEIIFGSDGMRAAGVLAKQGGEGFDAMAASMGKVTAESVALERLNNVAGDIEQLKGSLETASIVIASEFLPGLRGIAQGATAMVNTFTQEAQTLIQTTKNIAGSAGIGLIPAALAAVELRIGEVFGGTAQRTFHNLVDIVKDIGNAFGAAKDALSPFSDAFGTWVHQHLQGSDETTKRLAEALERLAPAIKDNEGAVRGLAAAFAIVIGANAIAGALKAIAALGTALGTLAVGAASVFGFLVAGAALLAIGYHAKFGAIKEDVDFVLEGILGMPKFIGDAFARNTAAIAAWAAEAGHHFKNFQATASKVLEDIASSSLGQAVAIGVNIVTGIVGALNPVALVQAGIAMIAQAIGAASATAQAEAPSVGANIINGIVNGITGGIPRVLAAAANMAQNAITAAMGRLKEGSPSKVFQEIGENVDQGFIDGIEALAPEVEAVVGDLMDTVGETASQSAEEAFAGLATLLGAQFEKTFSIVEQAQNDIDNARDQAIRQSHRSLELAERQHQRRMVDLEQELGGARGDARKKVLEQIAQEHENAARKVEDIETRLADTLDELAFDAGDKLAAAAQKQALLAGAAIRDFRRGTDDLIRDTTRAAEAIGKKAGAAVSDAMRDAADAVIEARDRASEAIAELRDNQALNRSIRTLRDDFAAGQDKAAQERDRKQEDADLEYKLAQDLAKAKIKLGRDRGKAETEDDRRQLDVRYAEEVENLKDSFEEAKKDLKRRREIADDNDKFRKDQQKALQAFNDALEDDALKRQIKRLEDERDKRIKEINAALDEKLTAIRKSEADEREALRQSAQEKLEDLRTRFYDKVGQLNEESKTGFESLFATIRSAVEGAAQAVAGLSSAINAIPSGPKGGPDGATWENQPQAVRDMFGGDKARWEREHAAELAAMARPVGEGYYAAVPDTDYWRANADRFDPLSYGDTYPEMAYSSSDPSSRDVFGGNNRSSVDEYATGGVVPGPRGKPRLAIVHGQEEVLTPEQRAARDAGAGYGAHGHDIYLDGQLIGRTIEPYVTGSQSGVARLAVG